MVKIEVPSIFHFFVFLVAGLWINVIKRFFSIGAILPSSMGLRYACYLFFVKIQEMFVAIFSSAWYYVFAYLTAREDY